MTPDGLLPSLAGGGVLGLLLTLAIVLIRQVTTGGKVSSEQTDNWRLLLDQAHTESDRVIEALTAEVQSLRLELRELKEQLRVAWESPPKKPPTPRRRT